MADGNMGNWSSDGLYVFGKPAEAWMVHAAIERIKERELRRELEDFLKQAKGKDPPALSGEAKKAFREAYYEVLMLQRERG